ncbi:MAG: hypothetical protein HOV81_33760 [Kofleriaceae bacterium]|nr:hypothetical protein [Kofleriaceae bacterium]
MTKTALIVGALVAGGVVFARGGCLTEGSTAPDQKLVGHLDDMCKIAGANVEKPVRGVKKLGKYLDKHAGDILGAWGDTLATIERIPDDKKHDDRARLARDRIHGSVGRCAPDWIAFITAVQNDPEASEMVERFSERLSRTLEIIGGNSADLRLLPVSIDRALSSAITLRR